MVGKKITWHKDRCKMCLNCVLFCPKKVLEARDNEIVQIDEAGCIECGICEKYCPDEAIQLTKNLKKNIKNPKTKGNK